MSLVRRVWRSLSIPAAELRCDLTLCNGQAFGWHPVTSTESKENDLIWRGVLDQYVIELKQTPTDTLYAERYPGNTKPQVIEHTIRDYLHLSGSHCPSLATLSPQWSKDPRLGSLLPYLSGLRLLRQSPHECLFSFICSSNNHISRITSMLSSLRSKYGTLLCQHENTSYYAFPTIQQLIKITEKELRDMGFGYRAKFIVQSATLAHSLGGESYLLSLRTKSREEVREALIQFPGIGPKVADCIGLFALDQYDNIPVDTHVLQIARRDYPACLKNMPVAKSMTPAIYSHIGKYFRTLFGTYAGWAHSYLFVADLPSFAHRFPSHLITYSGKGKRKGKATGKRKGKHQEDEDEEDEEEEQEEATTSNKTKAQSRKRVKLEVAMKKQKITDDTEECKEQPIIIKQPTIKKSTKSTSRLSTTWRTTKTTSHVKQEPTTTSPSPRVTRTRS